MIHSIGSTPCINCGNENNTTFCSECGQKQRLERLSLKIFLSDFFNRIYGLDGALFNTVIGLSKHPGKLIKEYISGVRIKYVGPVGYYFLTIGIYFLLMSWADVDLVSETTKSMNNIIELEQTESEKGFSEVMQKIVFENLQFFSILQFPFIAWWALLFFKKKDYNFLENIVFSFYVHGHLNVISIILLPIAILSFASHQILSFLIQIVYFTWVGYLFYDQRGLVGIFKPLLLFILSTISFIFTFSIVTAVIGLLIDKI